MPNVHSDVAAQTARQTDAAYPSVAALARELGMCERSTRQAIKRNEIPHLRLGRRIILPKAAIQEWLRNAGRA